MKVYRYILIVIGGLIISANHSLLAKEVADSVVQLQEFTVIGSEAERNLKSSEMGRFTISDEKILKMPVMFGEPDIVKTLQTLPGVSQGVEGFTGLYVRGGDNDQNLFLYQGLPLYHVSHLGGIFSSFNVATVQKVDFFKSSFPAIYGGRISSITDIEVKEPNFEKFTGRFSVGLLSGNAYISGPIIKKKTAFSAGLRRSWIDIFSIPALAVVNAINKKNGKKTIAHYSFTDFNARIDHRFSDLATLSVVGYYGHDNLKMGERLFRGTKMPGSTEPDFFDQDINKLSWGNWGVIGAFDWRLWLGQLHADIYYSNYSSTYKQENEFQTDVENPTTYSYNRSFSDNSIKDVGANLSYFAEFGHVYNVKLGIDYINHRYLPEKLLNESGDYDEQLSDNNGNPLVKANELSFYIDNNFNITKWVSLNAGVRSSLFFVQNKTHKTLEPRASVRVLLANDFSLKLGYSRMCQFVQQVSNNYVNLPTDLWQPISARFKPLESDQYSLGIYGNLPWNLYFSVEGWYKDLRNLLEYRDGISSLNPDLNWEEKLAAGKGWSYGVDVNITKTEGAFTGSIGYGLMWNWRKFDELNQGLKFPAKFDNRHKLNINVTYRLNDKIEFNAGWTFMTGNRMTLAMYNYVSPDEQFPDSPTVSGESNPSNNLGQLMGNDYYPNRNNFRLPAFHRLDLSVSFYKRMKNGRMGIWSVGLYNAYCRMNPMTIQKKKGSMIYYGSIPADENYRHFKKLSLIPVIPSVSYTYIF